MKIGMRRVLRDWVWRGAWGMGVVALLLVVRLVWGWEAGRRLEGVKAELRAKGVRLELPATVVPEEEDPYAALVKAMELVEPLSDDESALIRGDVLTAERIWTDDEKNKLLLVLERYQKAFEWVDLGRGRKGAVAFPGTDFIGGLARARELARVLQVAAILDCEHGQEVNALRDIRRILWIADTIGRRGNVISCLVATALESLAAQTVERLDPFFQFDSKDESLKEANGLLSDLLNPSLKDQCSRDYETEIASAPFFAHEFVMLDGWLTRPLRDDDVARAMQLEGTLIDGMRAEDWPTAERLFRGHVSLNADSNLARLVYWDSREQLFLNAYSKYKLLNCRGVSDVAAAADLIAARLYASAHHRLPNSVEEMVPEILTKSPVDPFSPVHSGMRYRLDGGGPTIWSVGDDFTDDGGVVRYSHGVRARRYDNKLAGNQTDIIYGAAWREAATTLPVSVPAAPGTDVIPIPGE